MPTNSLEAWRVLVIGLGFTGACVAGLILIRWLSLRLSLMNVPNGRASHAVPVPWTGGVLLVVVFVGVLFGTPLPPEYRHLAAYYLFIFALGFMDDLIELRPLPKLTLQILGLLALLLTLRATGGGNGFAGAGGFTGSRAALLMAMIAYIIFMQNAINFIDGVDGLAGLFSLFVVIVLAVIESVTGGPLVRAHALVALALMAFLLFNFSRRFKMFLGNSGSLLLGNWCSISAILLFGRLDASGYDRSKALFLLLLLFLLPEFDVLRVFYLRLKGGANLLTADRNHLHHALLRRGWSHLRVSSTLVLLAVLVFSIAILVMEG